MDNGTWVRTCYEKKDAMNIKFEKYMDNNSDSSPGEQYKMRN